MRLTYEIAMAAGRDAGNRSMRKAGRAAWNREDWDAAAEVTNKLLRWGSILGACNGSEPSEPVQN